MERFVLLIWGIFLSILGIVNMQGNVGTIHAYNRRRVREEDIPKYGRAVGAGTLVIGIGLALAFAATLWWEAAVPYIIVITLAAGLALIVYGQIKYNHGFF